jgi:hypothetical protein
MAIWYHKPRNLPARYYRYIGEVATRWNMVELHLQEIVWSVLDLDLKRGRLLTYRTPAREKINLFRALGKHWIKNHLLVSEFDRIANEVDRLNALRNDYVHGVFGHEPGKPRELKLFYIKTTANKILPRTERKTVEDVKRVADEIAALQEKLETIAARLNPAIKKFFQK